MNLKSEVDVTFQLYSQMGFLFMLCLDSGFWVWRDNVCILSCFQPLSTISLFLFPPPRTPIFCRCFFPGTCLVRIFLFFSFFFAPFGFRNASEGLGMVVCSFAPGNLFKTHLRYLYFWLEVVSSLLINRDGKKGCCELGNVK